HNEGDEPAFTQPQMYDAIRSHPTVRELYARRLQEAGIVTQDDAAAMQKDALAVLEQARREADESEWLQEQEDTDGQNGHTSADENPAPVAMEALKAYNAGLLDWPEGFAPNSKLERLLKRRTGI